MSQSNFLEALPDLILVLHRDGMILRFYGGAGVAGLKPVADSVGKSIEAIWPRFVTRLLRQLTHEALAHRAPVEATFREAGHDYDMRLTVQGSDTTICVIRAVLTYGQPGSLEVQDGSCGPADRPRVLLDFKELITIAALHKRPMAIAVIQIDGVIDVEQLICADISERLVRRAILRLRPLCAAATSGGPWEYLDRLGQSLLLLVLATADAEVIKDCVAQVCDNLRQPIGFGDAMFQLTPYCGVALLGREAPSHQILLRHASIAATEARRTRSSHACFYSEAAELTATVPLDIARELKSANTGGDIHLRYDARHDLASGRLVAWVGHLQWRHRLYGEIQPGELLRLAQVTGLSAELSAAALKCLGEDFVTLARYPDAGVRVSFGAPRQHLLHESFVRNMERFLSEGIVPAERLELRISVRTSVTRSPRELKSLARRGVQLVVDDIGRGADFSLDWLAHAPMRGLQLNGSWVRAVPGDEEALKMCRAGAALAKALRWTSIADGVDAAVQRDALLDLGCEQGSGELYGEPLRGDFRRNIMEDPRAIVAA
jgi:predicted signal transduction protein with EAL and GGDEF domain